ncbi:hypothetical protein K488DRAFT_76569 [Vararia minispora EC-137]|uniref:Uncharacterized protein n=1 Tax=Vararia minispora EC-137 TaxID=1314806 RepID=A0ACB8QUN6_9AGAM|nr:hypothetical protein K488DRAFT_76569 [Vararia minispora EC-137]
MATATAPTLYIWPELWDLPSWDAESLSTLLHLQLAIPGRFGVVHSTNPDKSPNGQLPYLTHGLHTVVSYTSIVQYISGLNTSALPSVGPSPEPDAFSMDLDTMLGPSERASCVAWSAHMQNIIGDLLAHVFFSLPENYTSFIHPALAGLYSVPQRYYVPYRLRALQVPRLDASGLWNLAGEEIEDIQAEKQPENIPRNSKKPAPPLPDRIKIWKNAFFRERVLERARLAFEPYARLLGENRFFFYDRPTSLDVLLASRVLLFTVPHFPDPLIGDLLRNSFPTLIANARSVLSAAFPEPPSANYHLVQAESLDIRSLLPFSALWRGYSPGKKEQGKKSEEEIRIERGRWVWIGVAALGTLVYCMLAPPLVIRLVVNEKIRGGEELEEAEQEEADDEEEAMEEGDFPESDE